MCVQLGLRRPWVSAVLLQGPGSDGPMGPSSAGHSQGNHSLDGENLQGLQVHAKCDDT